MKVARNAAFRSDRSDDWTAERIAQLSIQDIKQLRENAERLNESGVAALCSEALAKRRERTPAARKAGSTTKPRHLVPRTRAFEARCVWIADGRRTWSGAASALRPRVKPAAPRNRGTWCRARVPSKRAAFGSRMRVRAGAACASPTARS